MQNIILNTKEDLFSNIENVYKTVSISDFLDVALRLIDEEKMTSADLDKIILKLGQHNKMSFIGA